MSAAFKKIKMGHTPGDLPPEQHKNFPTRGAKEVVRKKTRAQQREQKRLSISVASDARDER
jgi:hypothetical protein